jgi:hypothetical protein
MTIPAPTSEHTSDDTFLAAFEGGTLGPDDFHHRDHLRVTWLALARWEADDALRRVLDGIRRYATAQGAAQKFDEALSRRWFARVADARRGAPPDEDFAAFLARHPDLMRKPPESTPGTA